MLHVNEITCTCIRKKDKIQPFIDLLVPVVQENYTAHREVAVHESVTTFKGRVSFRQYLKGKPNPWGIKAYVLSDSTTGYMHNLRIYFGKQTSLIDNTELSHTVKVVLTLVDHLKNKGYDLYTDQFYTSPAQADRLQKCGLTLTGTIMSNRCGLPEQFKGKHKMDIGSTESYRCGDMMALAWRDKRIIYMLSTKHSNDRKDVPSWYVYYICIFVMSFLFTLGDQQNPPKTSQMLYINIDTCLG